ncbi:MAG: Rieske 2Fe-2S domain-containing protein [Immundisolibacterales bacterium]|nr:Rieske 2Fe-2S domain-containing protein [Immundisolibacterales bacterium]
MPQDIEWPRNDYSRVPYRLYHDPELYAREQERIFEGPTWSYLCLEAEIPEPGDYVTTWVGDTPVVANRDREGTVHAFVNRCAHRGAAVCRAARGNVRVHTCIYHRWSYDHAGNLRGVPFHRGIRGEGGMDEDFDMDRHSLRKLRAAIFEGVVFGSFSDETEPLEDYLGPMMRGHIGRLMGRPVRVLGHQRQRIEGNWKLYLENLRDTYHASLLHEFLVTFGLDRATQKGGVEMDARHRHNLTYAHAGSDRDEDARAAYGRQQVRAGALTLRDPRLLEFRREYEDDRNLAISTVFPNAAFQQLNNSLATRQVQTKGIDAFDLVWTYFGYADDDEDMTAHRLRQANLFGPGGLVSMEDAEAIEIAQRASRREAGTTVVEVGGKGEISDRAYRVNDVPVRGFWSYYAELMDIEPPGAVR